LEALVRSGLGVDNTRGDAITVVSMPFDREPLVPMEEETGPDILGMVQAGLRPGIGILALIFAFVLSLKLLRFVKTVPLGPTGQTTLPTGDAGEGMAPGMAPTGMAGPGQQGMMSGGTGQQVALTDPALTAKVVKAWMSED
jgi:flagellar biosynthesis/type III secretory pathway M-ring protein FliF/YscJ